MEITYTEVDGILYPDIVINEGKPDQPLSKYGSLAKRYLKEHNSVKYQSLTLDGELMNYLHKLDEQAKDTHLSLEQQYLRLHPLPNDSDFMKTVQIRQQAKDYAEEIVLAELIYK